MNNNEDDFQVYYDGVYVFDQRWIKSRKDHKCTYCGRFTIMKGDEYFIAKIKTPYGELQTEKFCAICVSEMSESELAKAEGRE